MRLATAGSARRQRQRFFFQYVSGQWKRQNGLFVSLKPLRPTSSSKRAAMLGCAAIELPRRILTASAFLTLDLRRAVCPNGITLRRLALPRTVRWGIVSGRNPSSAEVLPSASSCRRPQQRFVERALTRCLSDRYLSSPSENYMENDRSPSGSKQIHLIVKHLAAISPLNS